MQHISPFPKNRNSEELNLDLNATVLILARIIRMIFIIPVFAVLSFLSIAFNDAAIYIVPLEALYESFALSAFFLLLLAFIQESDEERQAFFESSGTTAAYRVSSLTSIYPLMC
jgi:hypothetical protein